MAEQKPAVDFNQMIQADRARRKNEQLAANIFGRNRSKQSDGSKINRSATNSPSLASRIGIAKRSSSRASNPSQSNPFRPNLNRNSSSQAQRDRTNRISHALSSSNNNTSAFRSGGLSIKGKAGPWTVLASNFAPGTTAADIEAWLSPDAVDSEGHEGLLSCRIASNHPSVSAELVFTERSIADRVISTYNNQLADGRYLKLEYHKPKAPAPGNTTPKPTSNTNNTQQPKSAPAPSPREDLFTEDTEMLPIDDAPTSTQATTGGASEPSRYDSDREAAAASRDRRERETRRDDREFDPRDGPPPRDDRGRPDDGGRRQGPPPREQQDRGQEMRDHRYDNRRGGYDDRRYDDRPRYDDRGPSSYRGRGGRGYGGSVNERYARAAGPNDGGGRGYGGDYR